MSDRWSCGCPHRFRSLTALSRFTADTAAATGASERTVQRDAERGAKIAQAALALVRHTPLDKGTTLDALAKVPLVEQVQAIGGGVFKVGPRKIEVVAGGKMTVRYSVTEPPKPPKPRIIKPRFFTGPRTAKAMACAAGGGAVQARPRPVQPSLVLTLRAAGADELADALAELMATEP